MNIGDTKEEEDSGPKAVSVLEMKKRQADSVNESYAVGICLALIGGFLDAYTFILHDEVFANAQTGNMVLFAIYLIRGREDCLKYLGQIASFFFGVIVTNFIKHLMHPKTYVKFTLMIATFEFVILLVIGFLPLTFSPTWICVFIAWVSGFQVAAFRKMGNLGVTTTMCTGNLKYCADNLCESICEKKCESATNSAQYFLVIVVFMIGGVISSYLCQQFQQRAIWFCDALLIVIVIIIIIKKACDIKNKTEEDTGEENNISDPNENPAETGRDLSEL